jgi:phosphonatase-like hydrolase
MTIDLVVLDIAGTTVQEHGLVYEALREATGVEDVDAWMGADKREAIRALGASDVEAVHDEFRRLLSAKYDARPPAPIPGVPELFASLRAEGVKIALTTGFDREITSSVLERVGWDDDVIDAVVCADDVPAGRPAPYMVFRAMELTGVTDVSRVLVGGDTPLDIGAGVNAGAGYVVARSGSARIATRNLLPSVAEVASVLGLGVPA